MSRNHKSKPEVVSLRDKIKSYRKGLHGDIASIFDKCFCDEAGVTFDGNGGLKKALSEGKNLNAAFVAAKKAVDEEKKLHPMVVPPSLEEDD